MNSTIGNPAEIAAVAMLVAGRTNAATPGAAIGAIRSLPLGWPGVAKFFFLSSAMYTRGSR